MRFFAVSIFLFEHFLYKLRKYILQKFSRASDCCTRFLFLL